MPLSKLFLIKNTMNCTFFLQVFCSGVYLAVYKKRLFFPAVAQFIFSIKVSQTELLDVLGAGSVFFVEENGGRSEKVFVAKMGVKPLTNQLTNERTNELTDRPTGRLTD